MQINIKRRTRFKHLLLLFFIMTLTGSCSDNLFYMPRQYIDSIHLNLLKSNEITQITYELNGLQQTAFYITGHGKPKRLWLLFGGINSLALDWYQWFSQSDGNNSFLFVDYPGYGINEGVPRAKAIFKSSLTAYKTLIKHLEKSSGVIPPFIGVLGHSLGSGMAIDFASQVAIDRIILVAPFSNMKDLIFHRYGFLVGSILSFINPDKYPNTEKLKVIIEQSPPPEIYIVHGADDTVIPVEMSRTLAARFSGYISYYEIADMGHKNMFADNLGLIYMLMNKRLEE